MASTRAANKEWKALDTFPILVWKNMLLHLDKQSDRVNLINSSDNFKYVLFECAEFWIDLIFPRIACYLDVARFQACRSVCHYWKQIIDNYSDSKQLRICSPQQYRQNYRRKRRVKHSSVASFQEWKTNMNLKLLHPSVYRQILFNPASSEDKNLYYTHGIQHLRKIGRHVWHLKIGLEGCSSRIQSDHNVINYMDFALQCLEHVPNIRSFWLDLRCCELSNEANQQLEDYLKLCSFPQFKNLTWFHVDPCSCTTPVAKKVLETYQNQLQHIEVKACELKDYQTASLPELHSASLTVGNAGTFQAALHLIQGNKWRVTELMLCVQALYYAMEDCIDEIIKILHHSSKTLESLEIQLNTCPPRGATCFPLISEYLDESVFDASVTMMNLKKLDILHSTIRSWKFLATFCPNLEYLVVREERLRVDQEQGHRSRRWLMPNIDDSEYDYTSEIWDTNHKLKKVVVFQARSCECCEAGSNTYTRHGYGSKSEDLTVFQRLFEADNNL